MIEDNEIVFGPKQSFYADNDAPSLSILREEDGLFFKFSDKGGEQIAGVTLVGPDIEDLIKILKAEKKRLKKGGQY